MFYAETVGLAVVLDRVKEYAAIRGVLASLAAPRAARGGRPRLLVMREAFIVASSRTPLAKSFRGSFNMTRPDELAAHCIRHVVGKVPTLDPAEVEDVIIGCGYPHGPAGSNVAAYRVASGRPARSPRLRSP